MAALVLYPFYVFLFWYADGTKTILHKIFGINSYLLNILSVPLLLGTFFRPLKNEYRKGLVFFSIFAGMAVKSALLFVSLIIILAFLAVELILLILYLIIPFIPFYLWTL